MNSVIEVLEYFPKTIKEDIEECGNICQNLEEIRFRTNRNIILRIGQEEKKSNCVVTTKEILEILQRICDNSIYTYQSQICNGYITIKGGHRVRYIRQCSSKRWTGYKHITYL